ncbi:MAG TPA: 1-acyl-sn-glycerol-3-phosphate acyltransferase [Sandaracinaceae bacterium LLY-WYZ-13_1]|nr:1-acyl-sn-glycerol-3-phosphate acyltransferase [Sandaracinaceae bacterium LLY-WYZ-13_1]
MRRAVAALARAAADRGAFDPTRLDARDPDTVRALLPLFERIAHGYLRLRVEGEVPAPSGPVLYVANHNGGIMGPDLFCTLATLWRRLGPEAPLYAMAHDLAMRRVIPLGRVLQRVGGMRAHPDNARRAFALGGKVLVYPGGDLDAYRPFWKRDRVVFGPRAGFARIARDAGVPIVPIVAHGAHRSALIFHEGRWLARALGLTRWARIQRFPLALSLPWILGAGPWVPYLPLPFPIRLRFLPPIRVAPDDDPRAARDRVVERMQAALDAMARR